MVLACYLPIAEEAIRLYRDPGDKPARQLAGLLAREFAKQAAEAFAGQAGQVVNFGLALIAHDP